MAGVRNQCSESRSASNANDAAVKAKRTGVNKISALICAGVISVSFDANELICLYFDCD